ncbi:tetratricopeptide repeat protein [Magnetococcus sp. PR-3]|uniref:tetratricopeptide repeat protein n=1 Tax=Magnetococcus sp. PR-3 TaxID=3120355 RepID=UPI002FCE0BA0
MKHVITWGLIVLMGGLVTQVWAGENDWVRKAYYKSYDYARTQSYRPAIRAMLPVHKQYPKGYTVNLRLGWLYYLAGLYADSIRHYQTAMEAAPESVEAMLGMTLPLMAKQQFGQVELICNRLVYKDYYNIVGSVRLAWSLRKQGKLALGLKVTERLLVRHPTNVSLLTEQGQILHAMGKKQAALHLFDDLLTLDPENSTALKALNDLDQRLKLDDIKIKVTKKGGKL